MKTTSQYNTDDQRWDAVIERDPNSDGCFYSAVRTTKIYCRPDCPARRPYRQNVEFFLNVEDAETAGYRPCNRCNPRGISTKIQHQIVIERACVQIITNNAASSLSDLAAEAGMTPSHFQRLFKTFVSLSPKQYGIALRKQRLYDALPETDTVTAAIYRAGFLSSSRAYAALANCHSVAPSLMCRGGTFLAIQCAVVGTLVGDAVAAATQDGLRLVRFCRAGTGHQFLQKSFPNASLVYTADLLAQVVHSICRVEEDGNFESVMPIDIRMTVLGELVLESLINPKASARPRSSRRKRSDADVPSP